jgi:hypothetical protein
MQAKQSDDGIGDTFVSVEAGFFLDGVTSIENCAGTGSFAIRL